MANRFSFIRAIRFPHRRELCDGMSVRSLFNTHGREIGDCGMTHYFTFRNQEHPSSLFVPSDQAQALTKLYVINYTASPI
jgi:hypothetical protein